MRKRVAYIEFPSEYDNNTIEKRIDGLNIRFSTKVYSSVGMPSNAYIDVFNLNRDDVDYLATSANTYLKRQRYFRLYAGYEDDVNLVFSGQILEALPEGNPDVVLKIKGLSSLKWWGETMSVSKDNTNMTDLLTEATNQMGYVLDIDDNTRGCEFLTRNKESYSFTGSPMEMINDIQMSVGGVGTDDKSVYIVPENETIHVYSPHLVNYKKVLLINKNTGMVGIPAPTVSGCNVKILLNTSVRCGDAIEIKSERIPSINGRYFILSVAHDGEVRGKSWYTTLTCSRFGGSSGKF